MEPEAYGAACTPDMDESRTSRSWSPPSTRHGGGLLRRTSAASSSKCGSSTTNASGRGHVKKEFIAQGSSGGTTPITPMRQNSWRSSIYLPPEILLRSSLGDSDDDADDDAYEHGISRSRAPGLTNQLKNFGAFFSHLNASFGGHLLLILFCVQHLIKGAAQALMKAPMKFIFKAYGVPGPLAQIYTGVTLSPWAMKPIMGLCTDALPLGPYRKRGYMQLSIGVGLLSALLVALTSEETMSVQITVLCLFGMIFLVSFADLLTEATYAEHVKKAPETGPDMISFVWGGINLFTVLATIVASTIMNWDLRYPYVLAIGLISLSIYPTNKNYLGESRLTSKDRLIATQRMYEQPGAYILCVVMFIGTLILSGLGIFCSSVAINALASLVVGLLTLSLFYLVCPPTFALVNIFFTVQAAVNFNTQGASFYFFTDTEEQYPDGPHFSMTFYTGVLGVATSFASLIGVMLYQRFCKHWTYYRCLIFVNVGYSILCVADVIVFLRWNKALGLGDRFFVLGSSCAQELVGQACWMPAIVLISQLCQSGMEAMSFALLAGSYNLGCIMSSNFGALLLQLLGINPQGGDNEQDEFNNLWIASLISVICPLALCFVIPWFLPNAKQTDTLDFSQEISPWDRWRERRRFATADASKEYGDVELSPLSAQSRRSLPTN